MAQIMQQGGVMMRFALVLMALVLLGAATRAPAACRRFGTQLECDLGGSQLLIGTQAAPAPAYGSSLRPQLLQGGDLDDRPLPRCGGIPLRRRLNSSFGSSEAPLFLRGRAPLCPEEILRDGDSCWRAAKGQYAVRRSSGASHPARRFGVSQPGPSGGAVDEDA